MKEFCMHEIKKETRYEKLTPGFPIPLQTSCDGSMTHSEKEHERVCIVLPFVAMFPRSVSTQLGLALPSHAKSSLASVVSRNAVRRWRCGAKCRLNLKFYAKQDRIKLGGWHLL